MVTVRFFAGAAAAAKCQQLEVEGDSVGEVTAKLRTQLGPEFGRVLDASSLLVDAVAAHGDLGMIPVTDGTTIDVLPPFAGG